MGIPQDKIEDVVQDLMDKQAYRDWYRHETCLEDEDVRRARISEMLRAAIRLELSETQRAYFLAYYMEGLSMRDIAKRHGVNRSTASRVISLAREKLAHALKYTDPLFLRLVEKGGLDITGKT